MENKINFITPLPCNLYWPGDHFESDDSHVLALLSKFHKVKNDEENVVTVWGSGIPRREFLYIDDLAEAIIFLLENYNIPEIINVGTGMDISIKDIATLISIVVGYSGKIEFDRSKPDGMMRKLLNVSKIIR